MYSLAELFEVPGKYKVKKEKQILKSEASHRKLTASRLLEQEAANSTLEVPCPSPVPREGSRCKAPAPQKKKGWKWPKVLAVPGLLAHHWG